MKISEVPDSCVVVGSDGSDQAHRAVAWAADAAARTHRRLVVVHSFDPVSTAYAGAYGGWALDPTELRRGSLAQSEAVVAAEAERLRATHPTLEVLVAADLLDPRQALADLSRRAHLLVVGSRGHGPVAGLLLGSVSAWIARQSTCPVVVIRPGDTQGHDGVVVAVDGTPESLGVVEFAYEQASELAARLRVLHCSWEVQSMGGTPVNDPRVGQDHDEMRAMLSETVAGMSEKFPDVEVLLDLEAGAAENVILRHAETAALVVLGRHHRHSILGMLYRSVTATVIEHASCPVAVVPSGEV